MKQNYWLKINKQWKICNYIFFLEYRSLIKYGTNKRGVPTIMLPPTRNAAKLFHTRSISFRCCFNVSLVSPERQNVKNFLFWIYLNSIAFIILKILIFFKISTFVYVSFNVTCLLTQWTNLPYTQLCRFQQYL